MTAAYRGPAGLFVRANSGGEMRKRLAEGRGSRGGAPIWTMKECWMPSPCSCGVDGPKTGPSSECRRHAPRRRLSRLMDKRTEEGGKWLPRNPYRTAMADGHARGFPDAEKNADPDGFAVFGRYPRGWLEHVVRIRLLGNVRRREILHVCSGTLSQTEDWTVDIRSEAMPRIIADGCRLPFRDSSFKAVMLDPPYSDAYARNLYATGNPRPAWLLAEAARVVVPCGRIGMLHVAIPFVPRGCYFIGCWGITIGVGFRGRFFTVYEREQKDLSR